MLAPAARPYYHLSLPGTTAYPAFASKPARDPLIHWPENYEPLLDTPAWQNAMPWGGVVGFHIKDTVLGRDTGIVRAVRSQLRIQ